MLSALSTLPLLILSASATQPYDLHQQPDRGMLANARCGAVNFFLTAFLPSSHTTAFCSAYLQIPQRTSTSIATVVAATSTITQTSSQLVPTVTRTIFATQLSTSTATVDLWTGRPACSTIPSYNWIHDSSIMSSFMVSSMLEQACSCLQIPESTHTVVATRTLTPTVTATAGISGPTTVTTTRTQTAVETLTKFIVLVDRTEHNHSETASVREDGEMVRSVDASDPHSAMIRQSLNIDNKTAGIPDFVNWRDALEPALKLGIARTS